MKRLFVNAGLLAGLVLMLSVAGKAQISQQYRAAIPFDFDVKDVSYKAGDYTVGPVSSSSSNAALAILDKKSGKMQLLGLTQLGRDERVETGKLIFVKANGNYTLTRIVTPTFAMKIKHTPTDYRIAKKTVEKSDTVAVKLW